MLKLDQGEVIEKVISVREDFLTEENKKEKYLVIGTKRGKVKRLPLEKIGRVLGSGKRIINLVKYKDEISQVSFTSGQDVIAVFTKQGKSRNIAEEKLRIFGRAAYGDTVIKLIDSGKKIRCPVHQTLLEQHKVAPCCDKTRLGAQLQCPRMKEINKQKRECADCNKIIPIASDQIQDEMVSLLVIDKEFVKENLNLLAVREDKIAIKKPLPSFFKLAKRRSGKGEKRFEITEKRVSPYCAKHESLVTKLEEKRENARERVRDKQSEVTELENILNKARTEAVNTEVIDKYEQELAVARQARKE
ncbi:10962_t:CDS:1 [Ambispora leptoticha]|uniref:10962_t:CDS:1 n=1 Tax=Ambispora leptoticha TaxID=144679 RepID=A0A9N8VFW2_9GLOM|nr:10962_t:CDS:1 [Ambispora leptoticha]